ncbi:MAG: cell division ATP-binding protein FtsE [Gammaproteobacteria bacterium]
MLRFVNLNHRYPSGQEVLHNINFSIESGEMVFLTGHSGAGKSTLLRLAALLEKPTKGQVFLNNQCVSSLTSREIPKVRQSMGIIFQDPHLLKQQNLYENVALPLVIAGYRRSEVTRRARAALQKVNLLSKALRYPRHISAGEQIRVSIARALVTRPTILLADEPSGNLDPHLSKELLRLLTQFNDIGMTILMATHDLALINHLPYRQLVLRKGYLVNET